MYIERAKLYDYLGYMPEVIDTIPAADVVPVVRGEWVEDPQADGLLRCNRCLLTVTEPCWYAYCPNCGAKMKGE